MNDCDCLSLFGDASFYVICVDGKSFVYICNDRYSSCFKHRHCHLLPLLGPDIGGIQAHDILHGYFIVFPKPLEIMREIVKITAPGGRILDPFAGSGSTLAAARAEGYDALGIEVHGEIAAAAAERLGVEALKIGA